MTFFKLKLQTLILLGLFSSLAISCTSVPVNESLDKTWTPPTINQYKKAVKSQTQHHQEYRGFYNKFDLFITYLDKNIRIKQLKLEASYGQWDTDKANNMNTSLQDSLNQEAKFFISIYAPKREDRKLSLKSSGWLAKLYFDGEKYDGTFKVMSKDNQDLKFYYPHHSTWSKGFILAFPVPTNVLDKKPFHIKFTNPYGEVRFEYNQ